MNRPLLLSKIIFCILAAIFFTLMPSQAEPNKTKSPAAHPPVPEGHQQATLGAGCFWCVEAVLEQAEGIHSVTSGYMGGELKNPTYADICSKTSGHAEVVQVVYNPKILSYENLLKWFWKLHDPTTLNQQGADKGPQYRSAIFYHDAEQQKLALESKALHQTDFQAPIVTEITKASTFYPAENYHQDYYRNNRSQGYCRAVILPKLEKLKLQK